MTTFRKLIVISAVLASGIDTAAYAQATRTWISGVGDDANPCSRTAPCKTFAGAISKTAAGGEINCLDPGGYGGVTITKSITIDCTGTFGSALVSGTNGMTINGAAIDVILRGLQINGLANGTSVNGISFIQGDSLTVENVLVERFDSTSGNGLRFSGSTAARIHVINSTFVNNGSGTSGAGIAIKPTGVGSANVTLDNVRLMGNAEAGLAVDTSVVTGSSSNVVATRSTFSSNGNGIAVSGPGPGASVTVADSTVSSNLGNGLYTTGTNARIYVSNSTISSNTTGINTSGGLIATYGGNVVSGNGSAGAFNGSLAKQ